MSVNRQGPGQSASLTALKALRVLEAVAAEPRALALGEVAHRTGMTKSATHRMLATLMAAGYVRQDEHTRQYGLSYRVVSLSRNLLADDEVMRLARTTLEQLSAETGEGMHLAMLDGMETVLVQRVRGARIVAVDFQVGDRSQLHCTSIGKALLAYQAPAVIEAVIGAGAAGPHGQHDHAARGPAPGAARHPLPRLRRRRPGDGRRHALSRGPRLRA